MPQPYVYLLFLWTTKQFVAHMLFGDIKVLKRKKNRPKWNERLKIEKRKNNIINIMLKNWEDKRIGNSKVKWEKVRKMQ